METMAGGKRGMVGRTWFFWLAIMAASVMARPMTAQTTPTSTLVTGTVYKADGSIAQGALTISWRTFTASDGTTVTEGRKTIAIGANGTVSVSLTPTTGATPATYYTVTLKTTDGATSQEYWAVPAAASTTIAAVRSTVTPTATAAQYVARDYLDTQVNTLSKQAAFASNARYAGANYTNGNTIQAAISDAGATGTVVIPATYTGADSYTNPNNILIVDQRNGAMNISGTFGANAAYFKVDPWIDVKAYGAKGNGKADDTAAIDAAFAATGGVKTLFFPSGSYIYKGLGLDGQSIRIVGSGWQNTHIFLNAGAYFVDSNQTWYTMYVNGIDVRGGAGAIRNRSTATSQNQLTATVDHCRFYGYTGTAISDNSADHAYWEITNNTFYPSNSTTSIGVALSGDVSGTLIANNHFLEFRVAIKIPSFVLSIRDNDFLHFSAGSDRHAIWVVARTPNGGGWYQDSVIEAEHNRFGNEYLNATSDNEILVAAEDTTNTYTGDRLWSTSATTLWGAINLHDSYVNGTGGAPVTPFLYSYSSRIAGTNISNLHVDGTNPSYIIQYDAAAIPAAGESGRAFVGNVYFSYLPQVKTTQTQISNDPMSVIYYGRTGYLSDKTPGVKNGDTSTSGTAGYSEVLQPPASSWTISNGSYAAMPDSGGGVDAAQINFTSAGTAAPYPNALAVTANTPVWVEFDAMQGGSSTLNWVNVLVKNGSSQTVFSSTVALMGGWRRYRFNFTPRTTETDSIVFSGAGAGTMNVGKVHVYQGYDPVAGDLLSGAIQLNGSLTISSASTLKSQGTATASNNYNSATMQLQSGYWDGSAAQTHTWSLQATPGSGANPDNMLSITPSGNSSILFNAGQGAGFKINATAAGAAPALTIDGGTNGGGYIFMGNQVNQRDAFIKYNAADRSLHLHTQGGATGGSGFDIVVPAQTGTMALTSGQALTPTTVNATTDLQVNGVSVKPLSGATANIGGTALSEGGCSYGAVTLNGASSGMVVTVTPTSYPGDSFLWRGYVAATNTVVVKVCNYTTTNATPTATTYNVRVTP